MIILFSLALWVAFIGRFLGLNNNNNNPKSNNSNSSNNDDNKNVNSNDNNGDKTHSDEIIFY